jgi:predicted nucleic acid-binding protein
MIYLDTSVLLAFTLAKTIEPERYTSVARLFDLINAGQIKAATSFYTLHELLVIAISNTEPDWETGSELARQALSDILQTRLLLLPLPRREDKLIRARLFSALHDATDLPHAIAAHTAGCSAIVAYDEHFRAISNVLPYKTPEEIVAKFVLDQSA